MTIFPNETFWEVPEEGSHFLFRRHGCVYTSSSPRAGPTLSAGVSCWVFRVILHMLPIFCTYALATYGRKPFRILASVFEHQDSKATIWLQYRVEPYSMVPSTPSSCVLHPQGVLPIMVFGGRIFLLSVFHGSHKKVQENFTG